jgi:hypothetical protein
VEGRAKARTELDNGAFVCRWLVTPRGRLAFMF